MAALSSLLEGLKKEKMNYNNEQLESLSNVNPRFFGFGTPSATTKFLESEGLLSVELLEDSNLWHASLTSKGNQVLKDYQENIHSFPGTKEWWLASLEE